MPVSLTRNFCIIAHVDHGKTTLSDRLLEHTNTVEQRVMTDQHLDVVAAQRDLGRAYCAGGGFERYEKAENKARSALAGTEGRK